MPKPVWRKMASMLYALRSCGRLEASPRSNLVFQLRVHSLGISGFELGPHYCQLPVADEVQPDRNSYPTPSTVVWIVFESNYTRQTSYCVSINRTAFFMSAPFCLSQVGDTGLQGSHFIAAVDCRGHHPIRISYSSCRCTCLV